MTMQYSTLFFLLAMFLPTFLHTSSHSSRSNSPRLDVSPAVFDQGAAELQRLREIERLRTELKRAEQKIIEMEAMRYAFSLLTDDTTGQEDLSYLEAAEKIIRISEENEKYKQERRVWASQRKARLAQESAESESTAILRAASQKYLWNLDVEIQSAEQKLAEIQKKIAAGKTEILQYQQARVANQRADNIHRYVTYVGLGNIIVSMACFLKRHDLLPVVSYGLPVVTSGLYAATLYQNRKNLTRVNQEMAAACTALPLVAAGITATEVIKK